MQRGAHMTTGKTKSRMPLADKVYHSLHARIVNGDYPANEKLPPEIQLAEEFGVSRPVLRNALERLREEGIVAVAGVEQDGDRRGVPIVGVDHLG